MPLSRRSLEGNCDCQRLALRLCICMQLRLLRDIHPVQSRRFICLDGTHNEKGQLCSSYTAVGKLVSSLHMDYTDISVPPQTLFVALS